MQLPHISVCICTFRRAELLKCALSKLEHQQTDSLFTYSVVVADNDSNSSAKAIIAELSSTSRLTLTYCMEPHANIALARNKALEYADGDFIAFIDDDEYPSADWLLKLFHACSECRADGVLGPVKPYFQQRPPRWAEKGRFFEKATHMSGHRLNWLETRTSNVLFKRAILDGVQTPFRPQFATAGEDMDFFRRMIDKGCTFVWCNEAVVHEAVSPSRCTWSFLLKRALLRGANFPKHGAGRMKSIAKSLIAVPCYTLVLPVLCLFGQHVFLEYLIRLCDHSSRLLAFAGLKLITERHT